MNAYEKVKDCMRDMFNCDLIQMWNVYSDSLEAGVTNNHIYETYNFNYAFENKTPEQIAEAVYYGDYDPDYEYFYIDNFGHVQSIPYYEDIFNYVNVDEMAAYSLEHRDSFGHPELHEVLEELFPDEHIF